MKTITKLFAAAAVLVTFATSNLQAQERTTGVRLGIGLSGGVA